MTALPAVTVEGDAVKDAIFGVPVHVVEEGGVLVGVAGVVPGIGTPIVTFTEMPNNVP